MLSGMLDLHVEVHNHGVLNQCHRRLGVCRASLTVGPPGVSFVAAGGNATSVTTAYGVAASAALLPCTSSSNQTVRPAGSSGCVVCIQVCIEEQKVLSCTLCLTASQHDMALDKGACGTNSMGPVAKLRPLAVQTGLVAVHRHACCRAVGQLQVTAQGRTSPAACSRWM